MHCEPLSEYPTFTTPPDIYKWILARIRTEGPIVPFPTMALTEHEFSVPQKKIVRDSDCCVRTEKLCKFYNKLFSKGAEVMVLEMATRNFKMKDVDSLPFGIGLPLKEAIRACRKHPPDHWPGDAYVLIGMLVANCFDKGLVNRISLVVVI
jgi:anaphase-promoting complex subunit 1